MMNRRSSLSLLGCLLAALPTTARVQARQYRIGYLHPTNRQDVAYPAFMRSLKDHGYLAGKNTVVEERFAEDKLDRLPALAEELVNERINVLVAVSPAAIRAAHAATRTIPIVMAFSGDDPVKSGFAQSLAHPGGNITGLSAMSLDLVPKKMELLRDLVPGLKTVAALRSPTGVDHGAQVDSLERVAQGYGIRVQVAEVRNVGHYPTVFAQIVDAGAQALVVLSGPEFSRNGIQIVSLAAQHRLPTVYSYSVFVQIGGLASYGPDIADLSARSVDYVDKILKGADPAELPIEQPRSFYLAINRKTADQLGLKVSPAILLQADRVIQ